MKPIFIGKGESNALLNLTTGTASDAEKIFLTADDLKTHLHGIGAPRQGKSKLMEWIARELITQQHGFCLIDPHGQLYEDVLNFVAYMQNPAQEVILFDPSYEQRIVGFNPFRPQPGDVSTQADRLVQSTVKAWRQRGTDETPELERRMRSLFHACIELDLPVSVLQYLLDFQEKAIRESVAERVSDTLIRSQLKSLSLFKQLRDFEDHLGSTMNRLFRFLHSRQVRRIFSLRDHCLDFQDIIENGKILLVNLQPKRGVLTMENARLIGTWLLSELWDYASCRKRTGTGEPVSDFFVMIDEFQNFLIPNIGDILVQSPKYGLKFMLFHQYLDQLKEKDTDAFSAVMNAAQTKIVFGGLTDIDANFLVRELFPGEINLERIKFLNQQVEFWPVVGEATSYHENETEGSSHTDASGGSSGQNVARGYSFGPGLDDWVNSDTTTTVDMSTNTSSDTTSSSRTTGRAVGPFIYPEKHFVQKAPVYFTMEENIHQLAGILRNQFQRHYFIRRPGKSTVAAIAPFVQPNDLEPEILQQYVEECLSGFLTPAEVDHAIEGIHEHLQLQAGSGQLTHMDPEDVWEKKPLDAKAKN